MRSTAKLTSAAKSDKFLELVETITDTILANDAADVEALKNCTIAGGAQTVSEYMTEKIATIGENMNIRRFTKMTGTLVPYMHDGGRLGTLVKLDTDKPEDATVLACGKNVALQITALNAQYVSQADIPADVLANEKEVQLGLVRTENEQSAKPKPENVLEKIVEGRLRKYFEEVCLLDQKYFKDDTMSIAKYVESEANAAGRFQSRSTPSYATSAARASRRSRTTSLLKLLLWLRANANRLMQFGAVRKGSPFCM